MTLLYAHKLSVGDKVKGTPGTPALTVSSVEYLSDGRICIGYAERDGRGAVYTPRTIMEIEGDWRA